MEGCFRRGIGRGAVGWRQLFVVVVERTNIIIIIVFLLLLLFLGEIEDNNDENSLSNLSCTSTFNARSP